MYHDRIIKRIPGRLPPISAGENQGHLDNLSKVPYLQLLDLIVRQENIISNKSFVNKLPDKGEKIQKLLNLLKEEQLNRKEVESMSDAFAALKISSDDIEWSNISSINCSHNPKNVKEKMTQRTKDMSSDVEKESELQRLEKTRDRWLGNGKAATEAKKIPYVKHIIHKVENPNKKMRERFKPSIPKKSFTENQKIPKTQRDRHNWEVTAATPPPIIHSDIKVLNLEESVALQKEQVLRLKDAQIKHAQERLAEHTISIDSKTPAADKQILYCQRQESSSDSSDSESEDEEKLALEEEEEEEHENDVAVIVSLIDR